MDGSVRGNANTVYIPFGNKQGLISDIRSTHVMGLARKRLVVNWIGYGAIRILMILSRARARYVRTYIQSKCNLSLYVPSRAPPALRRIRERSCPCNHEDDNDNDNDKSRRTIIMNYLLPVLRRKPRAMRRKSC